jgi:hypothetical protein
MGAHFMNKTKGTKKTLPRIVPPSMRGSAMLELTFIKKNIYQAPWIYVFSFF